MIREICKDEAFLAQKAEPATPEDLPVAADLLETLEHHKRGCVGMAANMIGVNKRIIAFDNEGSYMVMFRPLRRGGGLSLPHRHPPGQAVEVHQGTLEERKIPGAAENLHRLDRPDHPARDRPLRGDHHMKKCKITVMRITQDPDLMAQYENPLSHACDMIEGQVFLANGWEKPAGFCQSAWDTLSPFVLALSHGAENFYDGWMKNPKSAMLSCNDGFRPVSFLVETLDEDAD